MKRFLWLGFVLCLDLICSGCGDTFRPIIIPNPPTFPNPKAAHTVVAINDKGLFVPRSAMAIDVAGDTDVSHANLDIPPVHAVQQTANEVLVVNQAVTGLNVPTTSCLVTFPPTPPNQVFNVCSSITKLNFSGTGIRGTNAISLPIYSGANFVAVAPSSTTAYVTMPTYPPDPTQPLNILPSVAVVNTQSNTTQTTVPVGQNPVALAVTPNNGKLYVANQGDSTISGFDIVTLGLSQRVGSPMSTSSPPIWLVARSDNQRMYVLEQNGTLAWLDTTSTAGTDILTESTTINVPGATTMVYDGNLNRLYIPGGPEMEIVDVSQSQPQRIATIPIPSFALLPVGSSAPATAAAAAALPDGSGAYVASYAVLQSQFNISSVTGDGTTATYAYTLTAGHDLTRGVSITVTGTGFDGTFIVGAILSGTTACPGTCFQAHNATSGNGMAGSGTGSNIFPQVTVVDAMSNTVKTTASVPGFPDATVVGSPYYAPICATTRFRFTMAAGGDSSRAYLATC